MDCVQIWENKCNTCMPWRICPYDAWLMDKLYLIHHLLIIDQKTRNTNISVKENFILGT